MLEATWSLDLPCSLLVKECIVTTVAHDFLHKVIDPIFIDGRRLGKKDRSLSSPTLQGTGIACLQDRGHNGLSDIVV